MNNEKHSPEYLNHNGSVWFNHLREARATLRQRLEARGCPQDAATVHADTIQLAAIHVELAAFREGSHPQVLARSILDTYTNGIATLTSSTNFDMANPNTRALFDDLSMRQQRQLEYMQEMFKQSSSE